MMLDGKFLILGRNNKTVWKRKGDAKSALKCHFGNGWHVFEFQYPDADRYTYQFKGNKKFYTSDEKRSMIDEAYRQLLSQITFVEVDDIK